MKIDKEHYLGETTEIALKFKDFLTIDDNKIHISISHEDDLITAIVMIEN